MPGGSGQPLMQAATGTGIPPSMLRNRRARVRGGRAITGGDVAGAAALPEGAREGTMFSYR